MSSSAYTAAYKHFATFTAKFAPSASAKIVDAVQWSREREIRVADFACGTGSSTFSIIDAWAALPSSVTAGRKLIVEASDFSPHMISQLDAAFAERQQQSPVANCELRTSVVDLCCMEAISDNTFDAVSCVFGVMFVPDLRKAFSEIHRVLKPGGQAVLMTWHYNEIFSSAEFLAETVEKKEVSFDSFLKFGNEGFLRRAVGTVFPEDAVQCSFVHLSGPMSIRGRVLMLNMSPTTNCFGHWDEAACHAALTHKYRGSDTMHIRGTALLCTAVKSH